jgi:hypothetical protein
MLPSVLSLHLLLVGVVRLLLARADNDVHKAAVVKEALVGSATGLLLLVGLLDLGGLRLDLTGTCEGTVDFACDGRKKSTREMGARHREAAAEIRRCEIESWIRTEWRWQPSQCGYVATLKRDSDKRPGERRQRRMQSKQI